MVGEFTTVWTAVSTWLTDTIASSQAIFYADNKLTFLGIACAGGVAVGLGLLVINKIGDLIKFR